MESLILKYSYSDIYIVVDVDEEVDDDVRIFRDRWSTASYCNIWIYDKCI